MSGRTRVAGDGSVVQRKDGLWQGAIWVTVTDGRRKRRYIYAKTQAEVARKLRSAAHDEQRGTHTPTTRLTVGEYLDRWLIDTAIPRLKYKSVEQYERVCRRHLVPGLGSVKLIELRPRNFQAFIDQQHQAGVSPRVLQQCRTVMSVALNDAILAELVTVNATHKVRLPRYVPKPIAIWRADQLGTYLSQIREHRWYAGYLIAAICGLRCGEVLGLRWCDVDFDNDIIHVRHQLQRRGEEGLVLSSLKTENSRRDVPMSSRVRQALADHAPHGAVNSDDEGFVLTSSVGTPVDPKNFSKTHTALVAESGLPRITLHQLRHIAATLAKDHGANVKDTQALLGHASPTTTQAIYQHGNVAIQRAVLERVEQSVAAAKDVNRDVVPTFSTGQTIEIDALTSGGPGGARTRDTLLKRQSRAPWASPLTSVIDAHLRSQKQIYYGPMDVNRDVVAAGRQQQQHQPKPHLSCPLGHDIDWLLRELHDQLHEQEQGRDLAA